MTPGAWLIIAIACFLVAAIFCAWEERRDEKRAREDFREHLAHPAHPVVGYTREEQIAALPGEVERMVRREVAG